MRKENIALRFVFWVQALFSSLVRSLKTEGRSIMTIRWKALNLWFTNLMKTYENMYSWAMATSWVRNTRAEITDKLVELVIVSVILSALLPVTITTLIATNTTGWDTTSKALWIIVPTLVVVGVFVLLIRQILGQKSGGI